MNINIYEKYKVLIKYESSLLSEECDTIYDNIFVKDKDTRIGIIDGGKLLNIFSKKLNDDYLSEFTIVGKTFIFEYFNYNSGENWVNKFIILEDIPITTC